MKTVQFRQWNCHVKKVHYMDNDRIALQLVDVTNGDLVATASVNLPDEECGEDETFIKDWSENEGMLKALVDAGIVSEPIGQASTGYVTAHKVKVLI